MSYKNHAVCRPIVCGMCILPFTVLLSGFHLLCLFLCINISFFFLLVSNRLLNGCTKFIYLPLLTFVIMKEDGMSICVQVFLWSYISLLLGQWLGVKSLSECVLNFIRNCCTVFQSVSATLHLYQQCAKVPVALNLSKPELFAFEMKII